MTGLKKAPGLKTLSSEDYDAICAKISAVCPSCPKDQREDLIADSIAEAFKGWDADGSSSFSTYAVAIAKKKVLQLHVRIKREQRLISSTLSQGLQTFGSQREQGDEVLDGFDFASGRFAAGMTIVSAPVASLRLGGFVERHVRACEYWADGLLWRGNDNLSYVVQGLHRSIVQMKAEAAEESFLLELSVPNKAAFDGEMRRFIRRTAATDRYGNWIESADTRPVQRKGKPEPEYWSKMAPGSAWMLRREAVCRAIAMRAMSLAGLSGKRINDLTSGTRKKKERHFKQLIRLVRGDSKSPKNKGHGASDLAVPAKRRTASPRSAASAHSKPGRGARRTRRA